MRSIIPPPLSLYIHFPWCIRKCPYCDFNSHQLNGSIDEKAYINALLADLQQDLPDVWGRPIHSIFMGGGTPSLFSAQAMRHLLSQVRALLQIAPDAEITMEVNPGSQEFDDLAAYRSAGINRLSFGIQSLDDKQLTTLGRIHNAQQASQAIRQAQSAGFDNLNLDMMFGLPAQDLEAARMDLLQLMDFNSTHISYYQLTLEANTLFASKPPSQLPGSTLLLEMFEQGQDLLGQAGYQQYEVSAYAKNHQYSQHNMNYWRFGDYLGIGAGAHSKVTFGHDASIRRQIKQKHPQRYMKDAQSPKRIMQTQQIEQTQLPFEYMLNNLRLKRPVMFDHFEQSTGLDRSLLLTPLQSESNQSKFQTLFNLDQHKLSLTAEGFLLSDEILKVYL